MSRLPEGKVMVLAGTPKGALIRSKRSGPIFEIPMEEVKGAAARQLLRLPWNAARFTAAFGV